MSQAKQERLSSLIDDELNRDEVEQSLGELIGDRELRALWDRYHLMGDSLRGEPLRRDVLAVAEQVRERLNHEPTAPVPRPRHMRRRWYRPVVGSALAAPMSAFLHGVPRISVSAV